jgi:phosphoribosyl 1,2-cyclic phosphodiesterase
VFGKTTLSLWERGALQFIHTLIADVQSPVLSGASDIVLGMAMTVSVLGSGSRGNATFIKTECVRLLIDAGLSRKETARRLQAIGEDPDGIDAVLITHEHNDHAAGLKTIVKDLSVKAHLTWGASRSLQAEEFDWNGSSLAPVTPGVAFNIGDAEVFPFRVPHDAAEPVAFSVTSGGVKVTQLTDIGYMPDSVAEHLRGSNMLILESNHDLEMLRVGPYPWNLKQRLMGRYGHLSNTAVGCFIREQYDGAAEHIVLAHLSSKNNHPELARQEAARALRVRGFCAGGLTVTSQDEAMPPVRL